MINICETKVTSFQIKHFTVSMGMVKDLVEDFMLYRCQAHGDWLIFASLFAKCSLINEICCLKNRKKENERESERQFNLEKQKLLAESLSNFSVFLISFWKKKSVTDWNSA